MALSAYDKTATLRRYETDGTILDLLLCIWLEGVDNGFFFLFLGRE